MQMRNLVLSAFPRAMRLPDPFTPNLKVDLLPEIGEPARQRVAAAGPAPGTLASCRLARPLPCLLACAPGSPFGPLHTDQPSARARPKWFTPHLLNVSHVPPAAAPPRYVPAPDALLPPQMRAEVDGHLAGRGPPNFRLGLRGRLTLPPADALVCGTKYNVPLINALAFYTGIRAVEAAPPKPGSSPAMATPHMELLQHLLRDLDTGACRGGAGGCVATCAWAGACSWERGAGRRGVPIDGCWRVSVPVPGPCGCRASPQPTRLHPPTHPPTHPTHPQRAATC